MEDISKINNINNVIKSYFEQNSAKSIVSAKDLMTDFIRAGIFTKDVKHGLPIRELLRELDKTNKLDLIPSAYAERKETNTNWYFVPSKEQIPVPVLSKKEEVIKAHLQSDKTYILDLCDTLLGKKAVRQKRFDFLLGDFHKDGVTRTKLSVGAYYKSYNLVVEQSDAKLDVVAKTKKKTVSGVDQNEQRKIYNKRRASVLKRNGIKLITFSTSDFQCDPSNKIIRNQESDLEIVKAKLKDFVK